MTLHTLCQCVIASMLNTTAASWAPTSARPGPSDPMALLPSDGSKPGADSMFEFRVSPLHARCHALQGPRCNARVSKSPSE